MGPGGAAFLPPSPVCPSCFGTRLAWRAASGRGTVSTRVLSYRPDEGEDGYFLLLASPKIKAQESERPKKTVVFVVDRSGSMSGK